MRINHLVLIAAAVIAAAGGSAFAADRAPKEVYGEGLTLGLTISNGGAGQAGLLRALAEDFIASEANPFGIGWVLGHSLQSTAYLRDDTVDMAIIYEDDVVRELQREGTVSRVAGVVVESFLIVGPKGNPAGLATRSGDVAGSMYRIMEGGADLARGVRFLSRDDGSGTNVRERSLWTVLNAKPWTYDGVNWYVRFLSYPAQALQEADRTGAYTLIDLGAWSANAAKLQTLAIYESGGVALDNRGFALIAAGRPDQRRANAGRFIDYMLSERAKTLMRGFGPNATGIAPFRPYADHYR